MEQKGHKLKQLSTQVGRVPLTPEYLLPEPNAHTAFAPSVQPLRGPNITLQINMEHPNSRALFF